jgi:hypothetical protein
MTAAKFPFPRNAGPRPAVFAGGCSTATSFNTLSTGRPAGQLIVRRPPTELFEEGAAVAISFAAQHCVLLET